MAKEKEEDGYTEIIDDNMIEEPEEKEDDNPNPEKDNKEVKSEEKPAKKDDEELEIDEPSDSVITKEFVEKHGLSPNLTGKPFDELATSYNEIRKYDTKLSQTVAEMQRKMEGFEKTLSTKEVEKVEKKVEEELPKLSDFIDDDGYVTDREGLEGYYAKKEALLEEKLLKTLEEKNKGTDETVQSLQKEKYQENLFDETFKGLSELYEEVTNELIDEAIGTYGKFLDAEDEETQAEYSKMYAGKPKKLARDILTYHKANLNSTKVEKTEAEKAADDAHNKQLKKLKNTKKTSIKSATDQRKKENEEKDDEYSEVMEEHFNETDFAERDEGRD